MPKHLRSNTGVGPGGTLRILSAVACLVLLTAGRLPLLVARSVIIPMETNPPVGTEFKVKVGETIVKSRFMDWNHARLDAKTTVSIDRFSQELGPDSELRSFGSTQASRERTGLGAKQYYCAQEIKAHGDLSYQLLASVTSDVEQYVRFCFSDENGDGRLDHVLLGGAKSRELQAAHKIEPVPFHSLDMQPDNDGMEFRMILDRIDPVTHKLLFHLRTFHGKKTGPTGPFNLWSTATGAEYKHKDKVNFSYSPQDGTKIPALLGYGLTVKSVDPLAGEATIVLDHSAEPMFYQSTVTSTNIIFIYI